MYRETIRAGKSIPKIEESHDSVRVSFHGGAPDTNIARFIANLPQEEQEDTDTMLILFHLCRFRVVSALQASPLLQKSKDEVGVILRKLAADHVGLLEPTRESAVSRLPNYRLRGEVLRGLGATVLYNRRTVDETDRKVLAHVKEYGRITNRNLQNFLDVPMLKARDILSDLAQRGVLMIVSPQTRGPRVEWGPGPKFPTSRLKKEFLAENSDQPNLPFPAPESPRKTRRRFKKDDAEDGSTTD